MAEVFFQGLYDDIVAGNFKSSADARVILVMTSTTCDTEEDSQNMADFTTIDEADGVGYVELDLANVAVAYDATNNRLELTADAGVWTAASSLGACTRDLQGWVLYRYVDGTDANDVAWMYSDEGGFPYTPAGGDATFTPNSEGIIQIGP